MVRGGTRAARAAYDHGMSKAHALWLASLIVACATIAAAQQQSARERCVSRCGEQHRGDSHAREGCELECPPPDGLTPVERCQFECRQESRQCDRGCNEETDEGERRGCLRRCGSRHHVSCPRECERREAPPP